MRKFMLITLIVLVACQLGFAQTINRTLTTNAISTAHATGKPLPVVPRTVQQGKARPMIWVTGQKFTKGSLVAGEPSFCDYNSGSQIALCPKGLQTAYQTTQILGANGGAGMVIAIVDFFSYPAAEANFAQFNADMGLPACTTANGCFQSVDVSGGYDGTGTGWDLESMLDIEYAHAMAPNAKIVYIQGNPYSYGDDDESVAALGCPASPYCAGLGINYTIPAADVVSNSWTYYAGEIPSLDNAWVLGKPLLFASGDGSAFPAYSVISYPCTSANVTCIGGTGLYVNPNLSRLVETGWSGAGGGCSAAFGIPSWQGTHGSAVCSPYRAAPDIAAVADTNTPVAVYLCNIYNCGYFGVGGTSVATPVTAGLVADLDKARVGFGKAKFTYLNNLLYQAAAANYPYFYYDIVSGYNGYYAGPGYDLITGLGNLTGKNAGNRFFGLP